MGTVEIDVSTGGCEHCQRALCAELSAVPGVWRVRLDAPSGRVAFCAIAPVDRVQVAEAVAVAGYVLRAWR